jgi:hypothetical protein
MGLGHIRPGSSACASKTEDSKESCGCSVLALRG